MLMQNRIRGLLGSFLIVAVSMFVFGAPASAFTVTELSEPAGGNPGDLCGTVGGPTCIPVIEFGEVVATDVLNLTWDFDGSSVLGPDLIPDFPTIKATGTVTVTSITASQVVLDITLNNTTIPLENIVGFTGSIVSFGMELDGMALGSLSSAGAFLDIYDTSNIAGGPGLKTDFCATTSGACNAGSEADGIVIGGSDSLQFTLDGVFDPIGGLTIRNLATKWQTNYDTLVTPDDPDVVSGNSSFEQPGIPAGYIPEPGTATLLGIGLLGLGLRSRRG